MRRSLQDGLDFVTIRSFITKYVHLIGGGGRAMVTGGSTELLWGHRCVESTFEGEAEMLQRRARLVLRA